MNSIAESDAKSLRRDWFWSFGADLLGRLGVMVVMFSYMTYLDREAAGIVIVSYSYVMTAWLLVDLGLALYGARQLALRDADVHAIRSEITACRLTLSIAAAALACAALMSIADATLPIASGFALYLVLRGVSLDWYFRGLARFRTLAVVNTFAGIAQLAALPFVDQDNWRQLASLPFAAWAVALAVAGWMAAGGVLAGVMRSLGRKSLRHLRYSIGYSLSNGLSTLSQQLPILALSVIFPPAQVAGIGFLHRGCVAGVIAFSSLGEAIYPRLVRTSQKSMTTAVAMSKRAMQMIGVLALFPAGGILVAYAIPTLRDKYFPGVSWVACLALACYFVLRSMRVAPMRLLFAANLQSRVTMVSTTVLVGYGATLTSLYFGDLFSIDTAMMAFCVAEFLVLVSICALASRAKGTGEQQC